MRRRRHISCGGAIVHFSQCEGSPVEDVCFLLFFCCFSDRWTGGQGQLEVEIALFDYGLVRPSCLVPCAARHFARKKVTCRLATSRVAWRFVEEDARFSRF